MCEPLDDGMGRRIDQLARQVRGLQLSVAGLVAAMAVVAFVSLGRTPLSSGGQPEVMGGSAAGPVNRLGEERISAVVPEDGSSK